MHGAWLLVTLAIAPAAGVALTEHEANVPPVPFRLDESTCARAAAYSESCAGRAMLVLRDGEVVFERYARGWTADRPHPLASGTKSFTGIVAAFALQEGLITGLEARVSDTLTEWKDDPRKGSITVRQLLDLSSGLDPDDPRLGGQGAGIRDLVERPAPTGNALRDRLRDGIVERARGRADERANVPDNRFEVAVGSPSIDEAGARFRYGPTHFYAFGAFLERALAAAGRADESFWTYLQSRVLLPAGIDVPRERFAPDPSGHPNLPGGGHLTAREWGRFGAFVLSCSRPTGPDARPRLDATWRDLCFEPSRANPRYGLTWWLLNGEEGGGVDIADAPARERSVAQALRHAAQTERVIGRDGAPMRVVMAAGAGKQRLYLLLDHGIAVVRFAPMGADGEAFDDGVFLRTLLGLSEDAAPRIPRVALERHGHSAARIGDTLFVVGGYGPDASKPDRGTSEVFACDLATGAAEPMGELTRGKTFAWCGVVDGALHAVGGDVERFDRAANRWEVVSEGAVLPATHFGAAAIGHTIYVLGGYTGAVAGGPLGGGARFDVRTGRATALPPLPDARAGDHFHLVAALDGTLHVLGRINGADISAAHWKLKEGAWVACAPLPTPAMAKYTPYAVVDGRLHVFGDVAHRYDQERDAWSPIARDDEAVVMPATVVVGADVYVLGGLPTTDVARVYRTATDRWERVSP